MNEFFSKIKSYIPKFSKKGFSYDREEINPTRDWNIILLVSMLLLVCSALVAFYFYSKIESSTLVSAESVRNESETKINNELLKKIIDDFNTRSKNLDIIKSGTLAVPLDPSI